MRGKPSQRKRRPSLISRLIRWIALVVIGLYTLCLLVLCVLRLVAPPFTVVQAQRRMEGVVSGASYQKRYEFRSLKRISAHLQHAVIAAEDARFYSHSGIDWKEVHEVVEKARDSGEVARGASTLTQQLIKNLFFTTHRNPARKVAEYALAPAVEIILGKQRILELYLNVVEWGPGVFGAEAAARYHYSTSAERLGREQAVRLAALLPSPLRRKPGRMDRYSAIIERRMQQMGW